jgi:ribosomal protein S18 acetylase RimI-like enzyme
LKREIRELDLWCSSCMVALEAEVPVAVLLGCKRPPETLVLRIAVHPDHRRRGHGRHLLTSLSAKLAILGPPRLLAEVPEDNAPARALFEACGWREERHYADVVLDVPGGPAAPPGVVVSVTVDDLLDVALPAPGAPVSWERTRGTLLGRRERLQGVAIASGDRLEAAVLYAREDGGGAALWSVYRAEDDRGKGALEMLVREVAIREGGRLVARKIDEAHWPLEVSGRWVGYESVAKSG